jgi:catechol 2,3-dioxygenase-like lactoylglutathione lyase family enzyme
MLAPMDPQDPPATSVADRLGRLAGVTVAVPDPDATAAFLCDGIGFQRAAAPRADGAIAIVCEGDYGPRGQTAIVLEQGPGALERETGAPEGGTGALELRAVTWEVADGYDLDALAARARAAGATVTPTALGGIAFADPAGNPLAFERADALTTPLPGPTGAGPRRLGHLNLKADRPPLAAAFYQDVLRLKLSEQIGDGLFFLRIGAEHHNLGLRPGAAGALHHLGCELSGWHAYQPILDRLSAGGWKVEYGPGRHVPGRNLFTYIVDPASGLRVELFADMAFIADETAHVPVRWEPGDRMTKTINTWGPTPPESFLA